VNKSVRFWVFSLFAIMSLALVACGGQPAAAPAPKAKAPASTGSGASGKTLELSIKGEELAFDKDALEATAKQGEDLSIHFKNTSQTQQHNWVLFNHNDKAKAEAFNEVAMSAVDTSYFPEDDAALTATVLAHITNKQPGEEETKTFPAPAPGDYLYICTVPGHFAAGDYGVLTIK
jgi:azurin